VAWRVTTHDPRRVRLAARRHTLRVLVERRLARQPLTTATRKPTR
jgi:hypothetical protein